MTHTIQCPDCQDFGYVRGFVCSLGSAAVSALCPVTAVRARAALMPRRWNGSARARPSAPTGYVRTAEGGNVPGCWASRRGS